MLLVNEVFQTRKIINANGHKLTAYCVTLCMSGVVIMIHEMYKMKWNKEFGNSKWALWTLWPYKYLLRHKKMIITRWQKHRPWCDLVVPSARYLPHLLGCLLTAPPVTNQIFATINFANDNSAIFCQLWVTVCWLQVAVNLWPQDPVYEWPLLNIFKYLLKIFINKL